MSKRTLIIVALFSALLAGYWILSSQTQSNNVKPAHATPEEPHKGEQKEHGPTAQEEDYERGPHNGRLLRKDDFAVEITIFEEGVPPQFRVYAYKDDSPIQPNNVQLTIDLTRLDGEVNRFTFTPEGDALAGSATVEEPHSFDVNVRAVYDGNTHEWAFSSYEGRTTIEAAAGKASGIETDQVGPATIQEKVQLTGRVVLNPNTTAQVRARFPGIVRAVAKQLGDTVETDDVLATVESNETLQLYSVKAPLAGVILARNTNIGDVAGDVPLFTISNLSDVWAEFHVFPRDVDRVKAGQKVHVSSVQGKQQQEGTIAFLLPVAEAGSQTVVARVTLDNTEGKWRAGMSVRGDVVISEREVPLSVKASGLQRFRDFTVVFAQVGDTYEVRMLELGLNDGENVEVLSGIKPGTAYVSANSYLIKADIEKSGASHDH